MTTATAQQATFKVRRATTEAEWDQGIYGDVEEMQTVAIGEGVHALHYSDVSSWTVIAMTASGKTLTLQRDKAEQITPTEMVAGGFVGHCTNNRSIKYDIQADPEGHTTKARIRKDGKYYTTSGERIEPGRYEFYDYNF